MKKRYYVILLLAVVMVVCLAFAACDTKKVDDAFEWDEYVAPAPNPGTGSVNLPAVPSGKAASPSIQIHYQRTNPSTYSKWTLWLWTNTGSIGSKDPGWSFNYKDDWGVVALYSFEQLGHDYDKSEPIGLLVRDAGWAKDISSDRYWTLGEIDENNYYHLYVIQGDANLYGSIDETLYGISAGFASEKQITINTTSPINHVKLYEGDKVWAESDIEDATSVRYNIPEGTQLDLTKSYKAVLTFVAGKAEKTCELSIIPLYGTKMFDDAYYYDGELGAIYSSLRTEFKVWSPFSTSIVLKLYEQGDGGTAYKTVEMVKDAKGVWSTTVDGDLKEKYYTYTVTNGTYINKEIVDPYAKSAGLNGLRGQIVDFSETNPDGWDKVKPIAYDKNELVVWETHVADVTSSTTWGGPSEHAKKFLGLIDKGTTYTENGVTVTTGFDHIKELGVNAVQLVPIFDQANNEANVSFNWGYNPLNYNVLEGAYSSNARDGYARIKEFKQVVQAYNEAGINIIMDVVYNHVSSAIGSNFDVLMPGYYFRYYANGDISSGSGCGNDTASDHSMFRKFMIDSVTFWAKEYKLGGFRFDLMGLHDLETMNQLTAALLKINPSIVVYGEPWNLATATDAKLAIQTNGNDYQGFGQFNDKMRDALIKGGLSDAKETGWATGTTANAGDAAAIVDGLLGITASSPKINDPAKTVNYVTCHDNYTLWDRIWATGLAKDQDRYVERARGMAVLANSIVMTSKGVSFMLAGEEFLRSKQELGATGDAIHNSYESSYKINELDYSRKITYAHEFEVYKKLVEFKTQKLGLKLSEVTLRNYTAEVSKNNALIEVNIKSADGTMWRIFYANFAIGANGSNVDLDGYKVYLDTLGTYAEGSTLTAQTNVARYQVIIAYK